MLHDFNGKERTYNERLFSDNFRGWLHSARFRWLQKETQNLSGSVFELGCYDARSIEYLSFEPTRYVGMDANWECGLDQAIKKYPQYQFKESTTLFDPPGQFDVSVAMETLEHLPRQELSDYIERLSLTAPILLATVPVEIGPVFLGKHLLKVLFGTAYKHTLSEVMHSTLGMSHLVEQDNHKGFSYRYFIEALSQYYDITSICGLPFTKLPPLMNFTVGIVAASRDYSKVAIPKNSLPASPLPENQKQEMLT